MYTQLTNGDVVIQLKPSEYETLLVILGYALGDAIKNNEPLLADHMIKLANRINQGNPQWQPYATISEVKEHRAKK